MKFTQYYSSSSGNLYMVEANNGKRLMIECGVTWSEIQKALNYDLSNIVACLVSHEHKDHSKAMKDVIEAGIDVYASYGTFNSMDMDKYRRAKIIAYKTLVRLADFDILAIEVHHDAQGPLGYVVREKATGEYLLFATDTSHISQRFNLAFSIVAIECSYDKEVLQKRVDTQTINETLAKRLLTSHLEKQNTIKYLADYCDLSKCTEINLLHLSGDNIDKEQARKDVEDRFFITTRIVNGEVSSSKN